jgi:hypothetical protein
LLAFDGELWGGIDDPDDVAPPQVAVFAEALRGQMEIAGGVGAEFFNEAQALLHMGADGGVGEDVGIGAGLAPDFQLTACGLRVELHGAA